MVKIKIEKDLIKLGGKTIGKISGQNLKDSGGRTLARIDKDKVKDSTGRTIGYIQGDSLKDSTGHTLIKMSDIKKSIDGFGGTSLAAVWLIFVR